MGHSSLAMVNSRGRGGLKRFPSLLRAGDTQNVFTHLKGDGRNILHYRGARSVNPYSSVSPVTIMLFIFQISGS